MPVTTRSQTKKIYPGSTPNLPLNAKGYPSVGMLTVKKPIKKPANNLKKITDQSGTNDKSLSKHEPLLQNGFCSIFVGVSKVGDKWIWESEEETKARLAAGLASVNIKCKSITIQDVNYDMDTRVCLCVCEVDRHMECYVDDIYIPGLTEYSHCFEDGDELKLEFCFD
jgi:hypothetical protein